MSPASPYHPDRLGPFCTQAIASFRRIRMSRDVRFALVREPLNPHAKPEAKATLPDLARAIHFLRNGAPIVLDDVPFKVRGWPDEVRGVSVTTLTEGGDPHLYIGLAWLDGGDWHMLQRALDSQARSVPTIGRAA